MQRLIDKVKSYKGPSARIMEVCGTHTMAIARAGIKQILPDGVSLVSGPGCPVCVTPTGVMDEVLRLSEDPNIIITTYGDLMRVPGSVPGDNLLKRKALGANATWVYSPLESIKIAEENPDKEVLFLGVGFETTAPGTALTVLEAKNKGIKNFSVLCLLKRTEPVIRALGTAEDFNIQGFLCPGHVATIVGARGFRFITEELRLPGVVSGFEPEDILAGIVRLLDMIKTGSYDLENEYIRAVSNEGNEQALRVIDSVFKPISSVWRGIGEISESGYGLRDEFIEFDGACRFDVHPEDKEGETGCRCGDVITGGISPGECPLFGKVCHPENPVGPCMVSGEGACAAMYQYGV